MPKRSSKKTKKTTEPKIKKKRGRKPKKSKVYDIDFQEVIKNREKHDNLILHLKVNASSLEDKKIDNPEPFDPFDDDTIAQPCDILEDTSSTKKNKKSSKKLKEIVIEQNNRLVSKQLKEVLVPFQDFNKTNIWPKKTSIACYWCCHEFDSVPIPIPVKYENKKFHVYGCFCSYNCASAHIFDAHKYDMWNQYSLLNFMYKKLHPNSDIDKIDISPPRYVLKKFGGFADIYEYREDLIREKSYNIVQPPMISLVPQVEENSYVWSSKKSVNKFLNFGKEEDDLVLKRSEPVFKSKTTLMDYLNISK
jgi:hypothetical protein